MNRSWALLSILFPSVALAGPIGSVSQLAAILNDAVVLEDFEGFSICGGCTLSSPNPLNSITQPLGWGIQPGATYSSGALHMHPAFVHGDDSNVLQGSAVLLVTFDQPQAAVGFDLIDSTGNVPYHDTVVFYNGTTVLGTLEFDIPAPGDAFAGWQDTAVGITSARITSVGTGAGRIASIDNVEWGTVVSTRCPADFNGTNGVTVQDIFDFLAAWFAGSPRADFNTANGVTVQDIFDFLAAWFAGC